MKILVFALIIFAKVAVNAQLQPVKDGVYIWNELDVNIGEDRQSRTVFNGVSTHLEYFKIHATTQLPNAKSNKPKANDDVEECIIIKEGLMKITIEGKSDVLGAGSVVLLMPKQMHTIENVGNGNLTYYVMAYKSRKPMNIERGEVNGGTKVYNTDSLVFKPSSKGGGIAYFDRPTAMCERFEMHITQLDKKGPSHAPHTHIETEIILVLSGHAEMTIDDTIYQGNAGDLFLANSQTFHSISNASSEPCKYLAFKWN